MSSYTSLNFLPSLVGSRSGTRFRSADPRSRGLREEAAERARLRRPHALDHGAAHLFGADFVRGKAVIAIGNGAHAVRQRTFIAAAALRFAVGARAADRTSISATQFVCICMASVDERSE